MKVAKAQNQESRGLACLLPQGLEGLSKWLSGLIVDWTYYPPFF